MDIIETVFVGTIMFYLDVSKGYLAWCISLLWHENCVKQGNVTCAPKKKKKRIDYAGDSNLNFVQEMPY